MNATFFDIVDALLIACTFVPVVVRRDYRLLVAPIGLAGYHFIGRIIINYIDDPALLLSFVQTLVSVVLLFALIQINYRRIIATLFLFMSLSGIVATVFNVVPPIGQGLAFNLWNFQSLCLHIIAILIIAGTVKNGKVHRRINLASD